MIATLLLLASCAGPDGPAMYCGALALDTDVDPVTGYARTCALIALEDADSPGTVVDATFTGPTRVTWYLPLPVWEAPTTRDGGGDCELSGVDPDGATGGLSATFDRRSGRCGFGPFAVLEGQRTSRQAVSEAGTATLTPSGGWLVEGRLDYTDYTYPPESPLQGTAFRFSGSYRFEGEPEPVDFERPRQRYGGECPMANACWTATDWTVEHLDGEPTAPCAQWADPAALGAVTYEVIDGGHALDWGDGTTRSLNKLPGACASAGPTDDNWTTALDFDAGQLAVSFRGNAIVDNVPHYCEVTFRAPMAPTPCP